MTNNDGSSPQICQAVPDDKSDGESQFDDLKIPTRNNTGKIPLISHFQKENVSYLEDEVEQALS